MPDTLEQILTDLYESEINVEISRFCDDGGVGLALGDGIDDYGAEGSVSSVSEIAEWLRSNAVRCYPKSEFAKKYGFV